MILGLDATNVVHALWHAQSGTGVVASCTRRLQSLLDFLHPSAAVACFDRRSFRHDLLPSYKAHRSEKPAGLIRDLAEAEDEMSRLCPVAFEDGYEADDCLATLTAIGRARGEQVVLASPDKDLRQCLCRGRVTILRKFSTEQGRLTCPEWYTADTLESEYGLCLGQWSDYQALCGDSTDGVTGCEGVGEKTAAKVIRSARTLKDALANLLGLPVTPTQRLALTKFRDSADLMLRLVTLKTDVSVIQDVLR
jgi:DNA polymerase-1